MFEGDNWKQKQFFYVYGLFRVYNWVKIKCFYKLLFFLKTIKSDNESDTTTHFDIPHADSLHYSPLKGIGSAQLKGRLN